MEEKINQYQEELKQLNTLLFELIQTHDEKCIADYLITLAKINHFSIHVMEEQKIKNFFKYHKEQESLLQLFQILKIIKEENEINSIEKLQDYMDHNKNPFHVIIDMKNTIKLAVQMSEKKNQNLERAVIEFGKFLGSTKLFPKVLLRLIKTQPLDFFNNYIAFLEYFYNLSSSQKFLKPINKRINFLQKEIKRLERENQHRKENQKKILKRITSKPSAFYYVRDTDSSLLDCEETKEFYWNLLLNQNNNFLKQLKIELEQKKKKWNNEWINIFLDQGFNATILNAEQLEKIKNNLTKENLKQILEILKKPIFHFLNIKHPLFIDILTQTSKEVLLAIIREIENNQLPEIFIKKYPQILLAPYFRYYEKNKNYANSCDIELSFFWNNNLLLKNPSVFEKIVHLIFLYDAQNIPYIHDSYFNDLDASIEQRNPNLTYQNFPTYLPQDLNKILEESIPIDMENINQEEEIIFLDEHFKKDELRYQIGEYIISRRKVQRYFKYLNTLSDEKEKNLLYAIIFHCSLFEFEIEEIKEILKTQKRLLKK